MEWSGMAAQKCFSVTTIPATMLFTYKIKAIAVVKSSGIEEPMALMVAPRTPSDKFRPK